MKSIVHVSDFSRWEELRRESLNKNEIVIFKFSTRCALSFDVEQTITEWYNSIENEDVILAKVDVICASQLSNYLADEFNIKHESPQAIWLDKQQSVKWHGSHFKVSKKNLTSQL
ncbi:MAG: DUF2847 family protein [Ignavibacteria bacterium]|jgi:bacillithiol system protein YtxJ